MPTNILLVEDDQTLGYALKMYLEMHDFSVSLQSDGLKGKDAFTAQRFDLCILDVMMPKMDGFMLAAEMKKHNPTIPLIFLTARVMKIDKLQGFHKGADDYIVKPVDEEELIARIQAVLRRSNPKDQQQVLYEIGRFQFDPRSRRLFFGEESSILTEKEANLLLLLCEHKNQLLDRKMALEKIWGTIDYFNRRSMDVHLAKLRKYLIKDPTLKITNVHGKGYILEDLSAL